MQCYKVVNNEGGTLYSALAPIDVRVQYVPGVRTVPAIGASFAFISEAFASDFIGVSPGSWEIWECEAENARTIHAVLQDLSIRAVREFWESDVPQHDLSSAKSLIAAWNAVLIPPTEGTLVADAVTLLRRVS